MTPEQELREALAHIIAGPPDNGVSHRRALAALDRLVAERDEFRAAFASLMEEVEMMEAGTA
jgi:hypothetical protein